LSTERQKGGREVKKRVENENNEASSVNNDGSFNSQHCASQMDYRRASSTSALSSINRVLEKLRILLKFLLFREEMPKHFVWADFEPVHVAIILPLAMALPIALVLVGYLFFGIVGLFVAYIATSVLVIEIPHCIFDR
jgi:hypothetical protein